MTTIRYSGCGLDNVMIENALVDRSAPGRDVYAVRDMPGLHRAIAEAIVARIGCMSGQEIRFLRTEMWLTQAELAAWLGMAMSTMVRCESDRSRVDNSAEALLRLLTIERLGLRCTLTVHEIVSRCIRGVPPQLIRIDGSDPSDYRPVPAAAAAPLRPPR